jgi:hypothetical protein
MSTLLQATNSPNKIQVLSGNLQNCGIIYCALLQRVNKQTFSMSDQQFLWKCY